MADGTYGQIPTSQCEFGCAVGGRCGTETQCESASWVLPFMLGLVGLAILVWCVRCCCIAFVAVKVVNAVND